MTAIPPRVEDDVDDDVDPVDHASVADLTDTAADGRTAARYSHADPGAGPGASRAEERTGTPDVTAPATAVAVEPASCGPALGSPGHGVDDARASDGGDRPRPLSAPPTTWPVAHSDVDGGDAADGEPRGTAATRERVADAATADTGPAVGERAPTGVDRDTAANERADTASHPGAEHPLAGAVAVPPGSPAARSSALTRGEEESGYVQLRGETPGGDGAAPGGPPSAAASLAPQAPRSPAPADEQPSNAPEGGAAGCRAPDVEHLGETDPRPAPPAAGEAPPGSGTADGRSRQSWDDGLIARRADARAPGEPTWTAHTEEAGAVSGTGVEEPPAGEVEDGYVTDGGWQGGLGASVETGAVSGHLAAPYDLMPLVPHAAAARTLRPRLHAMRELVGLSRARLDGRTLAEAGRVLDAAAERQRYSMGHTVVALAGATGGGKSTLFNALAGAEIAESGVRRPTTSMPLACSWTEHADGLLDRLGIPVDARYRAVRPYDPELAGLVLIDLPDHDSVTPGHRTQVDRLLELVDAVVWVVDPEKYADAVLHERYLRPLAGYAEVTFVVLNQADRLPGDALGQVLDDLRRLLDEDGLALGEHGEPGATVLAASALTGEGMGDLRQALGSFVAECGAAERRLASDVDGAAGRLRPAYVADQLPGLTEHAREDFQERLAAAAGAETAGRVAERAWRRAAARAAGTPWARWRARRAATRTPRQSAAVADSLPSTAAGATPPERTRSEGRAATRVTARPAVEEAVRALADEAAAGLPAPWARAVREAASRGGAGLAEAVDEAAARALTDRRGNEPAAAGDDGERERRRGRGAARAEFAGRPLSVVAEPPAWWRMVTVVQAGLAACQLFGLAWLGAHVTGAWRGVWWAPVLLIGVVSIGGPLLAWCCALLSRGPARGHGLSVERRLHDAAAACGRARVLEPVAAELLRYQEVREQYVIASGDG